MRPNACDKKPAANTPAQYAAMLAGNATESHAHMQAQQQHMTADQQLGRWAWSKTATSAALLGSAWVQE